MNILKLQDQLKSVPDQSLIGYVQNPTGQVPTYLALTELQRRKEMRNKYQTAAPEQKTVAEDLTQPEPQGIAAMMPQQPAPMPEAQPEMLPEVPPQGMAHGGTVHFADGGDTSMNLDEQQALNLNAQQALNLNALPGLNIETGESYMTPDGKGLYAGRFFKDAYRQDPNPLFKLFSRMPDSMVWNKQMAEGGEVNYAEGGLAGLDTGNMYDEQNFATGGIVAFADGGEIDQPWYKKMKVLGTTYNPLEGLLGPTPDEDTLKAFYNQKSSNPFLTGMPSADTDPTVSLYKLKALNEKPIKTLDDWNQINLLTQQMKGGDQRGGYVPQESPMLSSEQVANKVIDEKAKTPVTDQDPFATLKKSLTSPTAEKAKSMQDYAAEYKAALGEDPTAQAAKDRIAKMEAKAAEQESKSGWMALAKAGFAMAAGRSPRALQNIAEGATAGVNDYVAAQERLDKLRERHFELQSQLDRQARAEQVSAVTYGANSKERAEDRAAREKLEKMTLGNQLAIAQLNYGLNVQNKGVANRDKAIDNAMAKAKIIAEQKGISDAAEFDAIYQPILMQELAALGVTSGSGGTYQPPVSGKVDFSKGVYHPATK